MIIKNIACAVLLAFVGTAFAADEASSLPKKMEGKWGKSGNQAEVELIQMESPTKAKLKVIFWDGCTRRGETTAELTEGVWTFIAPGGVRCENITVKMTPVVGKNRFEGEFETMWRGAVSKGSVYLEW